jgi:hypothetical protein
MLRPGNGLPFAIYVRTVTCAGDLTVAGWVRTCRGCRTGTRLMLGLSLGNDRLGKEKCGYSKNASNLARKAGGAHSLLRKSE